MKTLILYYSYEGTTKSMVDAINEKYDVDIERLEVVNEKKRKGFGKYIWGGKQVMQKKEPELLPLKYEISEYDQIIIGTPVWASSFAPAIRTLLNRKIIKDKKVLCFCTDMGGVGHTFEDFEEALSENQIIGKLQLTNVVKKQKESEKRIIDWVAEYLV